MSAFADVCFLKRPSRARYVHAITCVPMIVRVSIRRLPSSNGLPLPTYMTPGAAGMDLYAAVSDDVVIDPRTIVMIPTGLEMAILEGFRRVRCALDPASR